ncbi:YggT family protein [Thiohalospira halophila DSM 15071]|uniref:YggT family protein n=1 Tax=Thiohalospira halophila DSM 15071 TaxID=1123397 RepID=A0A1I1SJ75_9GAMM|nr:YggT family protein [Thiohalospira halophila]SFD46539.1 YggT family protein [Thiohalospira halophila DSM 15071]
MAEPYTNNAAAFLIQTLFGLYLMALFLRTVLQAVRADPRNPVTHFLIRATDPVLRPLRTLLPEVGRVSLAALVAMLVIQALELGLLSLTGGGTWTAEGLVVLAIGQLLALAIQVWTIAIIVAAVLSWIAAGGGMGYNPVFALLDELTAPLLRPARAILPDMGGLDLSPLVVIIVLQLFNILMVAPVRDLGLVLMRG